MTKAEVVTEVAKKTNISKVKVEEVLVAYADLVKEKVKLDESVVLYPIGKFFPKHSNARKGRNPYTGESIDIPAKRSIKFSPTTKTKDYLNE